jgi:hypothetical protein
LTELNIKTIQLQATNIGSGIKTTYKALNHALLNPGIPMVYPKDWKLTCLLRNWYSIFSNLKRIETTWVRYYLVASIFQRYLQWGCRKHTRGAAASEQGELKCNEASSVSYRRSKISMQTSRSRRSPSFDISLEGMNKISNKFHINQKNIKLCFIYKEIDNKQALSAVTICFTRLFHYGKAMLMQGSKLLSA